MIYQAKEVCNVPELDVLSLLFDSPESYASDGIILHAEAADTNIFITKADARKLTRQIAHFLRSKYDIGSRGPGNDVVFSVCAGNYLLPTLFYGVVAAEGVYSAASTALPAAELARRIQHGPVKLLVCTPDAEQVAVEAANLTGLPLSHVLLLNASEKSLKSIDGSISCAFDEELEWRKITDPVELQKSFIGLLYTSGTTGNPKAVRISHANVVAEVVLPATINRAYYAANPSQAFMYRTLAHVPVGQISGVQGYFINPFFDGGTVYWMSKFDFPQFLQYNKELKITSFFTAPPIYAGIARHPLVTDQFDELKIAYSGGSPLSKEVQAAASQKLGRGKVLISQTWGSTEATGAVTHMPPGQGDRTGSISPLLPNMLLRLVDQKDEDVEEGQLGEALLKGPTITNGYHDSPLANSMTFTNGWYRTGDMLQVKDGKFYFRGRHEDFIYYNGHQIVPLELEELLATHPHVADAAVVAMQMDGTTVPRAYVVADEANTSSEDIESFVNSKVPDHMALRGGVAFLKAIPKDIPGKIARRALRELAAVRN